MKRIVLLLALLLGGIAVLRRLPDDLRQRASRLPGRMMAKMMEHMPDE
jgi:hypothetical protein